MAAKRIRLLTGNGDKLVDRISNLPQPIIHDILSRLTGRDVIRTCVLSKSLLSALTSFPSLDLNSSWFNRDPHCRRFSDYVKYSVQRLNITDTALENLKISAKLTNSGQVRRIVDAIDFAITKHMKLLDINFKSSYCCYLPQKPEFNMFSSSLTSLNLRGLMLSNFKDDIMDFCPVLENLSIRKCTGLKVLNFTSTTIRSVSLIGCRKLSRIKIQSPSLQNLIFTSRFKECDMDVSECQFLKLLWLANATMYGWVDENIPKLLHLEELKLRDIISGTNCTTVCSQDLRKLQCEEGDGTLKIRVKNLESLILNRCYFRAIDIEIPRSLKHLSMTKPSGLLDDMIRNLAHSIFCLGSIELEYDSSCYLRRMEMNQQKGFNSLWIRVCSSNYDSFKINKLVPPADVLKSMCPLQFTLSLETNGPVYHHTFIRLWNLIASFGKVEFLTLQCQSFKILLCLEHLKEVSLSPMYELKHLNVGCNPAWTSVSPEMIDFFLQSSPSLETMCFISTGGLEAAKDKSIHLHYGSRIGIKEHRKCCRRLSMRCWRHSLKKVELKNFDHDDEEKLTDYFLEQKVETATLAAPLAPPQATREG